MTTRTMPHLTIGKIVRLSAEKVGLAPVGLLFGLAGLLMPGLAGAGSEKPLPTVQLPVISVSLFTGGVGYFRHAGDIEGGVQVSLPFKTDEINDVLKSLVIDAPPAEPAASVVFPSQQPLERLLKNFLVDLSGHPTLADLLTQLRGSQVRVVYQGKEVEGRVLGLEQRPLPIIGDHNGSSIQDWFVNLASHDGLRAMPLRELDEVRLAKGDIQGDLIKALETLEQAGDHERKNLQLTFKGAGTRRVTVGYVVESSVWKPGYRLVLPSASGAGTQAALQGWAIVENQTDNDWNGVRLALVSGRPISFVQELYSPRYVSRPRVTPKGTEGVVPTRHEIGMAPVAKKKDLGASANAPRALAAPAPAAAREAGQGSSEEAVVADDNASTDAKSSLLPFPVSLEHQESRGIRFVVEGVTLPRRRGAMITFFNRGLPMERISLFNSQNHVSHPLLGVRMENDSGQQLPDGPVTVFEDTRYSGDALLDDLAPGQKTLLTYAIDQDVQVLVTPKLVSGRQTTGKISKGVLHLTRRNQSHHDYLIKNYSQEKRNLLVEHPRTPTWTLVQPETVLETTGKWYRLAVELAPGEQKQVQVIEELVREQQVKLSGGLSSVVFSYASEEGFSPNLQQSLARVSLLQGRVEEIDRKINELNRDMRTDNEEQARVRANLSSIPSGTAFHNRMMAKLDTLESTMENKMLEMKLLRVDREIARKHLATYIAALEI
ncbi:MAG: DUF4139 domain-containing protein [Magnetococcales bacterium]|nr:DUF4139 domain-containing protein [Magnetococcales bacterium]